MEQEDVDPQVIEEYRKAEILRKSMAVVKKHAQRMEDIRTSPERYDRIKGKITTKNPFAANLSSMQGTKRSMMMNQTAASAAGAGGIHPFRKVGDSPIRENVPGEAAGQNRNAKEGDDWYRPELGEIPYGTLTKANREKIDARDREIAIKEAELAEIM